MSRRKAPERQEEGCTGFLLALLGILLFIGSLPFQVLAQFMRGKSGGR